MVFIRMYSRESRLWATRKDPRLIQTHAQENAWNLSVRILIPVTGSSCVVMTFDVSVVCEVERVPIANAAPPFVRGVNFAHRKPRQHSVYQA
ncbi:MAG: hypothetical protein AMXMBFR33_70850 [Candidatus Xenobia bacterium]